MTMKKLSILAGALLAVTSSFAMAHGDHPGYLVSATDGSFVRDGNGNCIMTPNSTVMADTSACTGEIMKETMAEPEKKMDMSVSKTFALYFDFDSTVVSNVGNIVDYVKSLSYLEGISLVGHADPIGSEEYNQKLSVDRAKAVASELKAAGITDWKVRVAGNGEMAPAANCSGTGAQLIACLRPDRRVDVEIAGEKAQ